ncbi:hypothetical protein PoMZ_04600 [Pyricularia oryzae]|uniref:Autophagy-related protein 16 domain-containing protein n=1 Tax=Pyricularia oryzae TaxID=318829 RepID=A0A4P7NA76_PYROR|nr:hypothetical protein PoMZ_04600 [Pyricularia oryzae]
MSSLPDWRDEYLASVKEAEKNSPVNRDLVEACSQLQDRVAALEAERDALKASGASAGQSASDPASQSGDAAQSAVVARLRLDLAEALGTQERLQSRLGLAESELERLRAKTAEDAKTIRTLNTQCVSLSTKVKDRNEELQGKSKLVENVQDELIALTLQLNVMEQQKAKIQAENDQLVERWMKRMGQEAEAMNLANEPKFAKRG